MNDRERLIFLSLGNASRPASPVMRVLSAIAGIAVFALAIVVGGALLLIALALALALAAVIAVRAWWWQRRFSGSASASRSAPNDSHTLDGEYIEITRDD